MSIKSKDLSFNKQEPAFLRRMREANSGLGDRHERPIARPQRMRDPNAEEEDAPTYVDEDGGTLSKAEYEVLLKDEQEAEASGLGDAADPKEDVGGCVEGELIGTDPKASGAIKDDGNKQQVVDVGGPSKKRKVVKVIGAEDEDASEGKDGDDVKKPTTKKPKKKGKPIKLSFGDDEA